METGAAELRQVGCPHGQHRSFETKGDLEGYFAS
jgi:hypothetical protein